MTDEIDEVTTLLPRPQPKRPTPIPKLQLAIIMLVQICEPLTSQSIYPYINQLVSELDITGGDERKRPGVMKSALGDLLDPSNRARGFAYIPLVWATGASLGPLIGGSLSRPQERFPKTFTGKFWADFPYFLPCLATGGFVFFSFLVVVLLFKETVPRKTNKHGKRPESHDAESAEISSKSAGPLPLRQLFTFPIIISVTNYVALAFLNIALAALLPLFLAMPIEIGGLGLPPQTIGLILATYGCTTGLFQVSFFSALVRRFGEKRVFIFGLATCLPIFALFPTMSLIAQKSGLSLGIWILVGCVLVLGAMMDSSFGAIFMYIMASAPTSSRGTVNGLSQTTASLSRAIGPALSTSLFSLSVEWNILGGYAVYAFFFVLSALALMLARRLPEQVWDEVD
ncbi:major facilitator superfamily domain-containing protein [Mycena latifolia]|nr:major facilitator superfamily domain-containing protein [Mycena latifolia]